MSGYSGMQKGILCQLWNAEAKQTYGTEELDDVAVHTYVSYLLYHFVDVKKTAMVPTQGDKKSCSFIQIFYK